MHKIPHIREFSKNFLHYEKYNFLQKDVARYLLSKVKYKDKNILDLGCGNGVVFSLLKDEIKSFVGVDFSQQMLNLHPKNKNTKLLKRDFDTLSPDFFMEFDIVISSSSLQWSKDPQKIIKDIHRCSKEYAISLFCDKTFFSLREWFGIDTFLPSSQSIIDDLDKKSLYEKRIYKLKFKDAISQLRYIKKSGVSGGVKKLSVKEIREFIDRYQNDELEFEVLYIWS